MKNLLIVQPALMSYRIPVFLGLSSVMQLRVLTVSPHEQEHTARDVEGLEIRYGRCFSVANQRVVYQSGLLKELLREKYDYMILASHVGSISNWLALLFGALLKAKVCVHGQGLFRRRHKKAWRQLLTILELHLCDRYLAYTSGCAEGLKEVVPEYLHRKIRVVSNTLQLKHLFSPAERLRSAELGVLFIGRLRDRCSLDCLVNALLLLRAWHDIDFKLHVIGGGDLHFQYEESYSNLNWIKFYGPVTDEQSICDLSRSCFAGVYPGAAGLSVVHYFSLSLPAIVFSDLSEHMGPEPEYVEDGFNGYMFKKGDDSSLAAAIWKSFLRRNEIDMYSAAWERYLELSRPSLSDRIYQALIS
ncbi:MAG: glycosyltransferase [Pseudomonadota bacterium]